MVHPPFLPGYYLRTLAFWRWYPRLLLLSFEMLMILGRWILHTIVNRLSQYQLRAQLVFFVFLKLWLPLRILELTDVHQRRKVYGFVLIPCFSNFVSCHANVFSSSSHSSSTSAFASGIFVAWGIGVNLCTRFSWLNELTSWTPFQQCDLHDISVEVFPNARLSDPPQVSMYCYVFSSPASASSRVESPWSGVEEDPFDYPRRLFCSSPLSGLSRIMFSGPDLLQKFWLFHLRLGK